jgi:very-short-patch-repair endonuclease
MYNLKQLSRNLRKNQTPPEQKLWKILKNKQFYGYKFLRQFVIDDKYIVDFICRERKIIIEIDGGQHNRPNDIEYDKKRTEFLSCKGFVVVRFWNNDIDNNIEGVYLKLKDIFQIL